jgi:hypothetical protein
MERGAHDAALARQAIDHLLKREPCGHAGLSDAKVAHPFPLSGTRGPERLIDAG